MPSHDDCSHPTRGAAMTKTATTDDLSPTSRRALAASAAGDTGAAVRLLRDAVLQEPRSAVAHHRLGAELAQAGEVAEAESALATSVVLAPQLWIARFQLGLLQFTSGRHALAV